MTPVKILQPARDPNIFEDNKEIMSDLIQTQTIIKKMSWGTNEKILDHGCGSGGRTFTELLPIAEKTESEIYGLDNCQSMIDFASNNFSNPRIDYRSGELSKSPSPFGDLKFNKIFSLFVMHWIENFREELKALYEHLEPGGEMFISMILDAHFFELLKNLKTHEKWGELAKSHLVIPKWLNETGKNSDILIKVLEELGLEVEYMETGEKSYVCKSPAECANVLYSMNPFAKYLPENEQDELKEVYYKFILETETKTYVPHPGAEHSEYTWCDDMLYILVKKRSQLNDMDMPV